jgi:hypothetical protein
MGDRPVAHTQFPGPARSPSRTDTIRERGACASVGSALASSFWGWRFSRAPRLSEADDLPVCREHTIRLTDKRLELPRVRRHTFEHKLWVTNTPGSPLLMPVGDVRVGASRPARAALWAADTSASTRNGRHPVAARGRKSWRSADRHGLPVAVHVESATPHAVTLVNATIAQRLVPSA